MKKFLFVLSVALCLTAEAQTPIISLTQLQTGFDSPVGVFTCGDDRLFVLEQDGKIRIMSKSGVINDTAFLDITGPVQSAGNEQGLLGLAFSPNYKQDGFFYINYIYGSSAGSTRISRFSVNPLDSNKALVNSEVVLLEFTQPYTNHNGGNIMFGKDGYLYINQGDGGSGNDPQGNGQNKNTFLAKILRIDVTNQTTYAIPPSNPFVGQTNAKPEIWAYGVRNPWRASFDKLTGDMWIGDVGQDAYEEIDFQPASSTGGENYGWRCREGFHVTPAPAITTGCPSTGFVDPVYELPQNASSGNSCSITGGYVYRGAQYQSLFGRYLFTDYCSGKFWAIRKTGPSTFAFDTLQTFTAFQYTSFGQDNLGELYLCYRGSTSTNGRIYKIGETTNCNPVAFVSFEDSISGCAPVKLAALKGDNLSYQWFNSNGSLGGANTYELNAVESGWYKVLVSKTGQAGCEAMSDSIYVTVKDTTNIAPGKGAIGLCIYESPFDLTQYVSPNTGSFTGSGISGSSLNPATVNAGDYVGSYTYVNSDGCVSSINFNYSIFDTTALSFTPPTSPICNNAASVDLTSIPTPSGGSFAGVGVSNNMFHPALGIVGNNTVEYTFLNNDGCTSVGNFTIAVDNCSGIAKQFSQTNFDIYPNPGNGVFALKAETNEAAGYDLNVTDVSGRAVFGKHFDLQKGENFMELDLQYVSKGMYYLSLQSEFGRTSKKLIIQ